MECSIDKKCSIDYEPLCVECGVQLLKDKIVEFDTKLSKIEHCSDVHLLIASIRKDVKQLLIYEPY